MGSEIGKSLDNADRAYHQQAVERAYGARLNEEISWNNPDSGHRGSVTPIKEGRETATGHLCRQYKQTIVVDGKSQTAYGTACQERDGTWSSKLGKGPLIRHLTPGALNGSSYGQPVAVYERPRV